MHIGFLTVEYAGASTPQGGLGAYSKRLVDGLAERGHEVTVVTVSKRSAVSRDRTIRVIERRPAQLPGILRRLRFVWAILPAVETFLTGRRLAVSLMSEHRRRRVDVIQASNIGAPGVVVARQPFRPPFVTRFSSYSPFWRACNMVTPDVTDTFADLLEMRQARASDRCIAPSRFVADWIQHLEQIRVDVVRSPLPPLCSRQDDSVFERYLSRRRYILFLGTMALHKGIDVLAAALPGLLERHEDLVIAVAGHDGTLPDGSSGSDLLRKAAVNKPERLVLLGWLPPDQLTPVLRNALAVLLPSRVDNHSNACLETIESHVPAIVSDRSSLDEMIIDDKTGLVFENGSVQSFTAAVDRLLLMGEDRRLAMCRNISMRAESLRLEDRIGCHEQYYADLVGGMLTSLRDSADRVFDTATRPL